MVLRLFSINILRRNCRTLLSIINPFHIPLHKIWENTGFRWTVFSPIRTESTILSFCRRKRVSQNPYFRILYAMFPFVNLFSCKAISFIFNGFIFLFLAIFDRFYQNISDFKMTVDYILHDPNERQGLQNSEVNRRCSVKKVFLKILQNSQENTCGRTFFLNKVASLRQQHLWWLLLFHPAQFSGIAPTFEVCPLCSRRTQRTYITRLILSSQLRIMLLYWTHHLSES